VEVLPQKGLANQLVKGLLAAPVARQKLRTETLADAPDAQTAQQTIRLAKPRR
jgi:hypothetical protein